MTAETMVGTIDDFTAAMRALMDGDKPGCADSCTNVPPFVVTERQMSDAEIRFYAAESIAYDACQAFGARFECMPHRVRSRVEAMAEVAALTNLQARPGDEDRAFRKARRAGVRVVNFRGRKHV